MFEFIGFAFFIGVVGRLDGNVLPGYGGVFAADDVGGGDGHVLAGTNGYLAADRSDNAARLADAVLGISSLLFLAAYGKS